MTLQFEYRPATLTDWPDDVREGKKKATNAEGHDRTGRVADYYHRRRSCQLGHGAWQVTREGDGETADYSRLRAHLKPLCRPQYLRLLHPQGFRGFLRRELDFYIKNEVMHLDDIEGQQTCVSSNTCQKSATSAGSPTKIIAFLAS